jgi:hypothetical protein
MCLLAACSRAPIPPVITQVTAPQAVMHGSQMMVGVAVHDDDDGVVKLRVALPSVGQSTDHDFAPIYDTGVTLAITLPNGTPLGPFEYDLSVFDESGLESAIAMEMVTIQ